VTSPDVDVTVDNTAPTTFIVAPTANAAFTGSMPVQANASDSYGIQSVQFAIDNTPVGSALTSPDSPGTYLYSTSLSLAGLANGPHTLTETATDNAGNPATSAPVTFYVGSGPPVASITAPPSYSFAGGTTPITVTASGGTGPYTGTLLVDGHAASVVPAVSGGTLTFPWATSGVADGVHALTATVKDANGQTVTTDPISITVDNTAPEGDMYLPAPAPGYTYARTDGPTVFQVHASDANGISHVEFLVDGTVVSPAISTPDAGQSYLYSYTFDTSTLTVGLHSIQALVVDNAGNQTLTSALSLLSGPIDTTPPTLTLSHAADGQLGWNLASPVTETVNSSDPQSGLDPVSPQCTVDGNPATLTSAGTGAWTFPVAGVGLHGISCISTDNAGNKATAADAVIIDDLGATIGATETPSPNAAGWNNTSVSVSFTCSDPVSGVLTCPTPVTLVQGAGQSVTGTAKDGAGRSTSVTVTGINIDTTPPTLTLSHTADGLSGFNLTSPVTETVNSADSLSGLDPVSPQCTVGGVAATLTSAGPGAWTFPVAGAGAHSISCISTDNAGNKTTAVDTVSIDDLGAVIGVTKTPAPNAAGWNNTSVKISFSCSDTVSGVTSCPTPVTLVQGAGQSVSGTAKDGAGKSTSVTVSNINIDTTPPVVTVTGVANGATYLAGAAPTPTCTTTDALSGVAVKATALVTGGTAGMGLLTATCSGAVDVAGNAAAPVSVSYTVGKATPTVTWKAPAAINYGTALSGTQLNATASVAGTFSYSPAAGTVLLPGAQTLSVTFTPTLTAAYNSVTTTVPLTVGFPQACVTGTLGTNGGNVLVASGKSICLSGSAAKLIGSVTIQSGGVFWVSGGANVNASVLVLSGGTFGMIGGTLSGNINATFNTTVITNGVTILGPVLAQGAASFCSDKITGPVNINGSSKPILFGGTTSACGGNTVVGSVLVQGNTGGVGFSDNTITGPLNVVSNKGGYTYSGNTIHGSVVVTGNS
jgi:hypothetical protein